MEYGRRDNSDKNFFTKHDKRKSESNHDQYPKKPRIEQEHPKRKEYMYKPSHQNGHSKSHSQTHKMDAPLPALPPISREYERPVFTHASLTPEELKHVEIQSYDRLEFLGDAYLEIISSRLIWSLYKDHGFSAARMSQVRETLVKNETLSEFSLAYGFDKRLNIDPSSRPESSKNTHIKLNGDVFEAYVAAVVLSDPRDGFEKAEDWLTKLWEAKLKTVSVKPPDEQSKGELQKRIGAKGVRIEYKDERNAIIDKKHGIETYFMGVYLTGWSYENKRIGKGHGLSKKAAGMAAAKNALENTAIIDDCVAKKAQFQAKHQQEGEKRAAESQDT